MSDFVTTTGTVMINSYVLRDGRTVSLIRAISFSPVEVRMEKGSLFTGGLRVDLLPLTRMKVGIESRKYLVDTGGLRAFIDDMRFIFPGIHLYDVLLENKSIVPEFPAGAVIVFLGSSVSCIPKAEKNIASPLLEKDSEPEKSFWKKITDFFQAKKSITKKSTRRAVVIEQGFLAFKQDEQGRIISWFVSQEEFVNAMIRNDDSMFVLSVGEPE